MSGIRSGYWLSIAVVASALVFAAAAPAVEPRDGAKKADGSKPAGEPAAAAPAQEPELVRSMRVALAGLADSDPRVREQSRIQLMGMERRNLPAFQQVVERSRPLRPAQAVALREIVNHVYLAGEPYVANEHQGFLGVKLQPTALIQNDDLL